MKKMLLLLLLSLFLLAACQKPTPSDSADSQDQSGSLEQSKQYSSEDSASSNEQASKNQNLYTPPREESLQLGEGVVVHLDDDIYAETALNTPFSKEAEALLDIYGKDVETCRDNLWEIHCKILNLNDMDFANPREIVPGMISYLTEYNDYSPLYGHGKILERLYTTEGLEKLLSIGTLEHPDFLKHNGIIYRRLHKGSGYVYVGGSFNEITGTGSAYTYEVLYQSWDFEPNDHFYQARFVIEAQPDGYWKIADWEGI